MTKLLKQIKWQFLIFYRNNLIVMILAMAVFYMFVIYLLKDIGNLEKFTTLLIFNEPTMVGFIFIGVAVILERDQNVFPALFVSPLNEHLYLISRIVTLSAISMICMLGMVFVAKGSEFQPIHFLTGGFTSCAIFSFVGIYVISFTEDILHFVLRSIPLIIIMSLPFLNYFGITDIFVFKLFPVQGSLYLIDNSYSISPDSSEIIFGYLSLAIWLPLLYLAAFRIFRSGSVRG
ncbi:MAG: hypothetical protein R2681_03390 [Pyrinomonadaceae bacterium]